jgi:hypothetical protein
MTTRDLNALEAYNRRGAGGADLIALFFVLIFAVGIAATVYSCSSTRLRPLEALGTEQGR